MARVKLQIRLVNLNSIIECETEQLRKEADGVPVITNLEPYLPAVAVDHVRLSEVVRVLLHNALRYSPDGGQIVISSCVRDCEVEVNIRDQGVGARADFDNPLFDRWDLYSNNPIRKVVGTGLGLAIAREIVAAHGGRLWVDRLEQIGSEFHFTVPIASPAMSMIALAERPAKSGPTDPCRAANHDAASIGIAARCSIEGQPRRSAVKKEITTREGKT